MTAKETVIKLGKLLYEKKAKDITIIDIGEKSSFADFFINLTAISERQIESLAILIEEEAFKMGIDMKHKEGNNKSGWVLMDLGDIIVNIFNDEKREKYNLDKLWSDCDKIELMENEDE